jgi:hypothetical protein
MAKAYNFDNYEKDTLTKPRDKAWGNWAKFETVGSKVQGYIRDAFYRPAEGLFKDQRGITLEQPNGELINVGIKRLPFVLDKTDHLRIGDPLTVVFESEQKSSTKGFSATKIFAFYGTNLPENANNPTVKELDGQDEAQGGSSAPEDKDTEVVEEEADIPFE